MGGKSNASKSEPCVQSLKQQQRHIYAKLPTLHNRRLQDIAILMYKVKNDLVLSYISEIFTRKRTRYNLRNSDFEIPRFNTIR